MGTHHELTASVIVLASNDKKYLQACLESLLDQDMPPGSYELIYADNASTDGSADYVKAAFPTVRVVELEKNFGFAEGNNRAAHYLLASASVLRHPRQADRSWQWCQANWTRQNRPFEHMTVCFRHCSSLVRRACHQ